MIKLKGLIEQYGRWQPLEEYVLRIETYLESDFSQSAENAKALLESIGKEICSQKQVELSATASVNSVLKNAFAALGYTKTDLVTQVSSALATIGQQMGNLRNEIGATAHGRTLEEIEQRNDRIDELTKEFLIETTAIVACFLIRNFENENPRLVAESPEDKVDYLDCEDFNLFWDELYGEFQMGLYSYTASEILFNVDDSAYLTEYKAFLTDEEE
ncbi:abortive infection family protein [Phaeodactylibacter sp.]|uniref:abortive infection family protein n=1 Tax=Phaeodactylibacter sp. TaxID=1940289 RepID=UPI0025F23BE1|nr:abortive infection family protein [Phaeodactylibacter sp.]MCI5091173.1 abortive infection family protein [Phaeodactylibacter sp.]